MTTPRYIDRLFYTMVAAIVVAMVVGYAAILLDNFLILVLGIFASLFALALWALCMLALRRWAASRSR
jgi:heme A synthase